MAEAVSEEILDLEKCIKQYALTVEKNAKFLSSQLKENLFIAEIATKSIKSSK